MKQWTLAVVLFFSVGLGPCRALQLILPDTAYQGDMIVGKVVPPAAVTVNAANCVVSGDGILVIGVARKQQTDLLVQAHIGNLKTSKTVRILAYQWKIQRINGLPEKYVSPPPEALIRIKEDSRKVSAVRRLAPHPVPLFWAKGFIQPVQGRITGVFGSQRILNDKPRSPHSGVDFAAPLGAPVLSPADGIVRLVAPDMYLMGNTLMIDHGLGVQSIFIHLDRILVKESQDVRQGMTVARVGQSGRATGPHLHWGVSVRTTPIDPARLLENKSVRRP